MTGSENILIRIQTLQPWIDRTKLFQLDYYRIKTQGHIALFMELNIVSIREDRRLWGFLSL